MDSFRCIHAARLLLDHQLHGIPSSVADDLAPADRKIIQDATLLAFEQIVDQALARDVHCVLISGDCFDPDDRGLRGPAALVRGIGRLAEHDIAVVLQAGRPDLWSSWPAGLRFPANTHRLGTNLATSVSIAREGKLLATITIDDHAPPSSTGLATEHTGWQIHLPAVHPLGASPTKGTIHLHDECSPAQGLGPDETGPHGCTLIEIDGAGDPRYTFVPAAPVRWERFSIGASLETNRDDLLQEMASRLEQARRETSEKVWLVAWDLTGTGPLWEQLREQLENRSFRDKLLQDLTDLDPAPGVRIYTQALRTQPVVPAARPNTDGGGGVSADGPANDLAAEFAMRLDALFAAPNQAIETRRMIERCLAGSAFAGGPWEARIESLSAKLETTEIVHDARRLATRWFAGRRFEAHGIEAHGIDAPWIEPQGEQHS